MATKKRLIYKDDARAAVLRANPSVAYCIDQVKAVDAVEVVRCKDCKKWLKCEPSGTSCRVCADSTRIRLPYDFCSYGERKEDHGPA